MAKALTNENVYDFIASYDVSAGEWKADKWSKHLRNGGGIKIFETEKETEIPVWELFEIGFKLSDDDTISFGIRPKLGIFFSFFLFFERHINN